MTGLYLSTSEDARSAKFIRQWRILVELRQGPRSLRQLAEALAVHPRTVRRDISALQRVPLPITSRFDGDSREGIRSADPQVWSLGATPAWPRDQLYPIADLASEVRS